MSWSKVNAPLCKFVDNMFILKIRPKLEELVSQIRGSGFLCRDQPRFGQKMVSY